MEGCLEEESAQLWELNRRLEAYVGRVQALEERNGALRAELDGLRARAGDASWRARAEAELAALRAQVGRRWRERREAELARAALEAEAAGAAGRLERQRGARERLAAELARGRRAVEAERGAHGRLSARAAALERELEALRAARREELARLEAQAAAPRPAPLPARPPTPAPGPEAEALRELAGRLGEAWRGAVRGYQERAAHVRAALGQARGRLEEAARGARDARLELLRLRAERGGLQELRAALEQRLEGRWQERLRATDEFQLAVEALEQEKQGLQGQIAQILEGRQQLAHLKMSLSLEVATYRTLLEAENSRLLAPNGLSKVAVGIQDPKLELHVLVTPEDRCLSPLMSVLSPTVLPSAMPDALETPVPPFLKSQGFLQARAPALASTPIPLTSQTPGPAADADATVRVEDVPLALLQPQQGGQQAGARVSVPTSSILAGPEKSAGKGQEESPGQSPGEHTPSAALSSPGGVEAEDAEARAGESGRFQEEGEKQSRELAGSEPVAESKAVGSSQQEAWREEGAAGMKETQSSPSPVGKEVSVPQEDEVEEPLVMSLQGRSLEPLRSLGKEAEDPLGSWEEKDLETFNSLEKESPEHPASLEDSGVAVETALEQEAPAPQEPVGAEAAQALQALEKEAQEPRGPPEGAREAVFLPENENQELVRGREADAESSEAQGEENEEALRSQEAEDQETSRALAERSQGTLRSPEEQREALTLLTQETEEALRSPEDETLEALRPSVKESLEVLRFLEEENQQTSAFLVRESQETQRSPEEENQETSAFLVRESQETQRSPEEENQETSAFLVRDSQETQRSPEEENQQTSVFLVRESQETQRSPEEENQETSAFLVRKNQETQRSPEEENQETSAFLVRESQETQRSPEEENQETSAFLVRESQETQRSPEEENQETSVFLVRESQETQRSPEGETQESMRPSAERKQEPVTTLQDEDQERLSLLEKETQQPLSSPDADQMTMKPESLGPLEDSHHEAHSPLNKEDSQLLSPREGSLDAVRSSEAAEAQQSGSEGNLGTSPAPEAQELVGYLEEMTLEVMAPTEKQSREPVGSVGESQETGAPSEEQSQEVPRALGEGDPEKPSAPEEKDGLQEEEGQESLRPLGDEGREVLGELPRERQGWSQHRHSPPRETSVDPTGEAELRDDLASREEYPEQEPQLSSLGSTWVTAEEHPEILEPRERIPAEGATGEEDRGGSQDLQGQAGPGRLSGTGGPQGGSELAVGQVVLEDEGGTPDSGRASPVTTGLGAAGAAWQGPEAGGLEEMMGAAPGREEELEAKRAQASEGAGSSLEEAGAAGPELSPLPDWDTPEVPWGAEAACLQGGDAPPPPGLEQAQEEAGSELGPSKPEVQEPRAPSPPPAGVPVPEPGPQQTQEAGPGLEAGAEALEEVEDEQERGSGGVPESLQDEGEESREESEADDLGETLPDSTPLGLYLDTPMSPRRGPAGEQRSTPQGEDREGSWGLGGLASEDLEAQTLGGEDQEEEEAVGPDSDLSEEFEDSGAEAARPPELPREAAEPLGLVSHLLPEPAAWGGDGDSDGFADEEESWEEGEEHPEEEPAGGAWGLGSSAVAPPVTVTTASDAQRGDLEGPETLDTGAYEDGSLRDGTADTQDAEAPDTEPSPSGSEGGSDAAGSWEREHGSPGHLDDPRGVADIGLGPGVNGQGPNLKEELENVNGGVLNGLGQAEGLGQGKQVVPMGDGESPDEEVEEEEEEEEDRSTKNPWAGRTLQQGQAQLLKFSQWERQEDSWSSGED